MKKLFLIFLLTAQALLVAAQVSVEARIDSIEMMMGEQVHVTLTVSAPEGSKIVFPQYKRTQQLVPGVEVLETRIENDNVQVLTLTSFDENLYYLPPFPVLVNGDTVKSKELALKVIAIDVDTTHYEKFFGPKDVQDNPFLWSEWAPLVWLTVLMLVLLALGGYLFKRLRDNKPIITYVRVVKKLLPHQKAMKEIEQIKADKMQSSENQKEYYTKLTDTIRRYIEERYGFSAMEMTSSEIIERLMQQGDQKALDELRMLFQTADLVKFAKYSTLINENDMNLVTAVDFINSTKAENLPTEEVLRPQLSEEDQRSMKTRRVLKIVISVIAVICLCLLAYVVYGTWELLS
jgi:hypothetical protein